jgi:hypothetical protein
MISFKQFVTEAKAKPKPKAKLVDTGNKMVLGHLEAYRHMKSRGANFSGWVVSNRYEHGDYTDPISTREEAKKVLRQWYDEDVASGKARRYDGLDW